MSESSLPARAKALAPLLKAQAEAGEAKGELTGEVVEALHAEGMFAMWLPRLFGGAELDPVRSLEVVESLAYADTSTGWTLMATALCVGMSAAYLGDAAVAALFGGNRTPVMAGQGIPNGRAAVRDGGYLLSGSWSYASGLKHSQYVYTAALVEEGGEPRKLLDGSNEIRVFVVPRGEADVKSDWDVLGLRATGSVDYSLADVFVPDEWTHTAAAQTPLRGGALYTLGLIALAAIGHTGFALGAGRRMLDELAEVVRAKAVRPGSIADSESFLERFAAAEGDYRAARALAYETWTDVARTLERGEPLTTRQRTLIVLTLNRVTWVGQEVCAFAYFASGGIGLRRSSLQRVFRDVHAATQHGLVSPPLLRHAGRDLAGLAQGHVWRGFGLVEGA
jgi:alkylation response protein AidB-like acyl-CoA dehydrogenase